MIVTAGPARGRTAPLEGTLSIGRDPGNALPIGDPTLSRQHCIVEVRADSIVIRDLASRNGVFVNGSPVSERKLADGDQMESNLGFEAYAGGNV